MHSDLSPRVHPLWLELPSPPIATIEVRRTRLVHLSQQPCRVPVHVPATHVLCINTGAATRLESTIDGRHTVGRSGPGDVGLYPAGLAQSFRWHEPAEFLQIHFDPTHLDRIGAELHVGDVAFAPRRLGDDALLVQLARSIRRTLSIETPEARVYAETLIEALAFHLVYHHARPSRTDPGPPTGSLSERRLRQVVDHVQAHLGDRITVDELAAIACCSTGHFARSFKKRTGLSPHRFHVERRLDRARELLGRDDSSIAEISLGVGFASQSHLTRHFKRRFGVTPGAYRRRTSVSCKHRSETGDTSTA